MACTRQPAARRRFLFPLGMAGRLLGAGRAAQKSSAESYEASGCHSLGCAANAPQVHPRRGVRRMARHGVPVAEQSSLV